MTLPDVQSLPEGSVTCTFAPDELDLRVRGTDGKEKYLLVRPLHEPIDPAASSFSVKRCAPARRRSPTPEGMRLRAPAPPDTRWSSAPHIAAALRSNRVLVKLCKASAGTEWRSVDDSARRDQERKQDKAASNQGKSTAQLLSELYGDADEEAKKKLEEAWEKGREKREAR